MKNTYLSASVQASLFKRSVSLFGTIGLLCLLLSFNPPNKQAQETSSPQTKQNNNQGCPAGTFPYMCSSADPVASCVPLGYVVVCPDGTKLTPGPTEAMLPSNVSVESFDANIRSLPLPQDVLKDLQETYQQVKALKAQETSTIQLNYFGYQIMGKTGRKLTFRAPNLLFICKQNVHIIEFKGPRNVRKSLEQLMSQVETILLDGTNLYVYWPAHPDIYLQKTLPPAERSRAAFPTVLVNPSWPLAYLLAGKLWDYFLEAGEWEGGAAPDPQAWHIVGTHLWVPLPGISKSTSKPLILHTLVSGAPKYGTSTIDLAMKPLGNKKYQLTSYSIHIWDNLDTTHSEITSTLYWHSTALPMSLFRFHPPKGARVQVVPPNVDLFNMEQFIQVRQQMEATKVGQVPPPLDVVSYPQGKPLTWKSFRGKVVLLDFWAPWCAPCVAMLPQLRQLYGKYHQAGLEIVGICEAPGGDVGVSSLADYLRSKGIDWWVSVDRGGKGSVSEAYKVEAIPFTVLVGRDGRVVSVGGEGAKLERAIVRALGKR